MGLDCQVLSVLLYENIHNKMFGKVERKKKEWKEGEKEKRNKTKQTKHGTWWLLLCV